jgi:hypothetical protein
MRKTGISEFTLVRDQFHRLLHTSNLRASGFLVREEEACGVFVAFGIDLQ